MKSGNRMDLREIHGIGDKLAEKIISHFGGVEEFYRAVENFEVDHIASVDGVSQRRAIEIVNTIRGNPVQEFLKTDRAVEIYDDILERMISFTNTTYAKNRMLLLTPQKDKRIIQENIDFIMNAKEMVRELPRERLRKLLKNLNPLNDVNLPYNPSIAIFVDNPESYQQLMERGLNHYHPLLTPSEMESLAEYELVIYVYSDEILECEGISNMVLVNIDSEDYEIVPNVVINYFKENYKTLQTSVKIKEIIGRQTVIRDVIKVLDSLDSFRVNENLFDDAVEAARIKAEKKLKSTIKNVDLKGEEVLDLLDRGMPPKIQKIFDDVLQEACNQIKKDTGVYFDPFIPKYPLEIDEEEFKRIKDQELAKRKVKMFEAKVDTVRFLSKNKKEVEKEIKELMLFDYEFSLGCFAYYYDLNPPRIADGFYFNEGLNLKLKYPKIDNVQKIDYTLKYPDNVVLLTGANSGGKTTLLETLAQMSIMTHMGLPICAREAEVKLVDEIYFFSKKRSLDAGAFESFLNTFIPILTNDNQKLILLDELEAITELDAAVKIISSFMEFIKDTDSFAIIVTHMAREILKYTQVRVDGIEAQGLDDSYNLIVDRTPRMNYLARSTPELILRMVYEKSEGKLKGIYGQILDKFN